MNFMLCELKDLYQTFRQNIYGLMLKHVRNKNTAEDLTSETFSRICACKADGKECNNPKAYLYRVALNLLNDHFRKSKKNPISSIDNFEDLALGPEQINLNKRVIECLLPLIDQLPPIYREALTLADFEQLPQQKIAERLGVSISGAKSRIQRARQHLKGLLLSSCQIESDKFGNITTCIC